MTGWGSASSSASFIVRMHPGASRQPLIKIGRLGEWTHHPPTHQYTTTDDSSISWRWNGFNFWFVRSCLPDQISQLSRISLWLCISTSSVSQSVTRWLLKIWMESCFVIASCKLGHIRVRRSHMFASHCGVWNLWGSLHIHWCLEHTIQFFKDKNWVKITQRLP